MAESTAQGWVPRTPTSSPSPRDISAAAFDVARGVTVLFGGYAGAPPGLADTWEWNGSNWAQRTPAMVPAGRWGHSMAYDSHRMRTVMFGGYIPGVGTVSDTWEYDGSNWALRTPVSLPPVRGHAALAYDSTRNVTVLYGGYLFPSTYYDDTWEWNGNNWVQRSLQTAPSARRGPMMTYDSVRGEMVMFGGANGTAELGDTWVYGGTNWTQRQPTTAPGPRLQGTLAYDSMRGRAVLHGGADRAFTTTYGDSWEWDGSVWAQVQGAGPSPRVSATMVYDARRGVLALSGGSTAGLALADTWEWQRPAGPLSWTANNSSSPGIRVNYPLSTDLHRQRIVLFGGIENSNTWEWNGSTWILMHPPSAPAWRHGAGMAYDEARTEHVMFGGSQYSNILNETWTWNGSTWVQKFPATVPPARREAILAFDAARGVIVLYGGSAGPTTTLSDMWQWNGTDWSLLTPANNPGPWSNRSYAYDRVRGELLIFGAGTSSDQTWVWNGLNWIQRHPLHSPGSRWDSGMAFHLPSGKSYLYGGQSFPGAVFLGGTWSWDGVDWTQESTSGSPCSAPPYAGAYDPVTQKVLIYIGHPWAACGTWLLGGSGGSPSATFATYGHGCEHSNGVTEIAAVPGSLPRLGSTFTARFANVPGLFNIVIPIYGYSNTSWGGAVLPQDLAAYGMPGCQQYVQPVGNVILLNTIGSVDFQLAIPSDPGLMGLPVFMQALVFDPFVTNMARAATTNAGIATIGW